MEYISDILPEEFLKPYMSKKPKWGYNGLGEIVYKRTYSRIKEDGTNEEWWETVARCINGAQKIGADYTTKEAQQLYDYIFNLKCNFAGRMLWQLGTSTVDRFGANSLLNCWGVCIRDIDDFCFIFENLMLGGGVGFSIRKEDVHDLPRVKEDVTVTHKKTNDADFIVPDTREGWVKLLKKVLKSFFYTGESFTYSTILVRSGGEPIRGFGGKASGPGILIEGIEKICNVIRERESKKLRSIDVLDICNIVASIVIAGNIRRSATIALGDPDDYLFLRAKRWDLGNVPNWRAMSNNTIYADSYDHISDAVWKTYDGSGEPYGFFNLPLSQKNARVGDKSKDKCETLNPCCLVGDTLIETNFGQIPILEITKDPEMYLVMTYNHETQEMEYTEIISADMTRPDAELVEIIIDSDNGEPITLHLTPDHQIWTENRGYVEAGQLEEDDEVVISEKYKYGTRIYTKENTNEETLEENNRINEEMVR